MAPHACMQATAQAAAAQQHAWHAHRPGVFDCGRRRWGTAWSVDRAIRAPDANPDTLPSAARCGCFWGGATGPCRRCVAGPSAQNWHGLCLVCDAFGVGAAGHHTLGRHAHEGASRGCCSRAQPRNAGALMRPWSLHTCRGPCCPLAATRRHPWRCCRNVVHALAVLCFDAPAPRLIPRSLDHPIRGGA